jgi:hypothetical protein
VDYPSPANPSLRSFMLRRCGVQVARAVPQAAARSPQPAARSPQAGAGPVGSDTVRVGGLAAGPVRDDAVRVMGMACCAYGKPIPPGVWEG